MNDEKQGGGAQHTQHDEAHRVNVVVHQGFGYGVVDAVNHVHEKQQHMRSYFLVHGCENILLMAMELKVEMKEITV